MVIPPILITLAWICIVVRCGIRFYQLVNRGAKDWLEILFQLSVALIALSFVL